MAPARTQKDPSLRLEGGVVIDGRYRVIGPLGAGGVGAIYEAEHEHLGRRVALKVLHDRGADADMRHRFEREAKGLASMSHPHVVGILDYGFVRDVPYLVMELLEGQTLGERLERGVLEPSQALELCRQILSGLGHAHEKGLVHRDLKPANIWLMRDERGADQVKILDFGFAKRVDDPQGPMVTNEGMVLGTPAYLSPEQATASKLDGRSDLYGVGVLLFEMLCGRRPFEGDPIEMIRGHVTQEPPSVATFRPELAAQPDLLETLSKALRKPREERFQSAREFSEALLSLREGAEARRAAGLELAPIGAEGAAEATLPDAAPGPAPGAEGLADASDTVIDAPAVAREALGLGAERTMQLDGAELAGMRVGAAAGREDDATSRELRLEPPQLSASGSESGWPSEGMTPAAPGRGAISRLGPRAWVGISLLALIGLALGAWGLMGSEAPLHERAVTSPASPEFGAGAASAEDPPAAPSFDPFITMEPEERVDLAYLRVRAGEPLDRQSLRSLRLYAQGADEDPRPHLLMARSYFLRGSMTQALTRYEWAVRAHPSAAQGPWILDDLVAMVQVASVSERAGQLIERAYGPEAIASLAAALEPLEEGSYEARRLLRLRSRLGSDR